MAQANATCRRGHDPRSLLGLEGKTLTLNQGELPVTRDLTIDGDRNNDGKEVTVSGGDASRILRIVGASADVSLRDLTLLTGGPRPGIARAVVRIHSTMAQSLRLDGTVMSASAPAPKALCCRRCNIHIW